MNTIGITFLLGVLVGAMGICISFLFLFTIERIENFFKRK